MRKMNDSITILAFLSESMFNMEYFYSITARKNEITLQGGYSSEKVTDILHIANNCDKIAEVTQSITPQGYVEIYFTFENRLLTITLT